MALSPDGKAVFMAPNGVTMTVGDVPSMKAIKTITFSDHVRPFVINHDATHVYANLNNLLGFEIADVKTGEVIKRIEAPAEMWKAKWGDLNLIPDSQAGTGRDRDNPAHNHRDRGSDLTGALYSSKPVRMVRLLTTNLVRAALSESWLSGSSTGPE